MGAARIRPLMMAEGRKEGRKRRSSLCSSCSFPRIKCPSPHSGFGKSERRGNERDNHFTITKPYIVIQKYGIQFKFNFELYVTKKIQGKCL